jgi:hypothetical protein
MLGARLVTALHPDARQRRVDEKVPRLDPVRMVCGDECIVEVALGKVHLGECVPRLEGFWGRCYGLLEFGERRLVFA